MKTLWYARSGEILKCGPFFSQEEAFNKMKLIGSTVECPIFHDNLLIWPETKEEI